MRWKLTALTFGYNGQNRSLFVNLPTDSKGQVHVSSVELDRLCSLVFPGVPRGATYSWG